MSKEVSSQRTEVLHSDFEDNEHEGNEEIDFTDSLNFEQSLSDYPHQ